MRTLKWGITVLAITVILPGCGDSPHIETTSASTLMSDGRNFNISMLEKFPPDLNQFILDEFPTDIDKSILKESPTDFASSLKNDTSMKFDLSMLQEMSSNIDIAVSNEIQKNLDISNSKTAVDSSIDAEAVYNYEVKTNPDGTQYAVIKGFRDNYVHYFAKEYFIEFPKQLGGAKVTAFAPYAFQNIPLGKYGHIQIAPDIDFIGAHCFENCGLTDIVFEKRDLTEAESETLLTVQERAFAGNPELWGVYFSDRNVFLENKVFANCAETGYLCYMSYQDRTADMADYLKAYHMENQWNIVAIPAYYSSEPIVEYPDTPLILKPEVGNFFNGDNVAYGSIDYYDNAPDYGFPEWHIPCGEFCAMMIDNYEINASSTLFSNDERYAAKNLDYWPGRSITWAEGVDGNGIGESIYITSGYGYNYDHALYPKGTIRFLSGDIEPDIYDGYMRYTQICIVNGYAKNQKTWEENGRVKRLFMYVEGRPFAYLELEDTIYPQYFNLPFDAIKAADAVDIDFTFVIEDVYEGTTYEDTCLTGLIIDFMGRRTH